MDMQEDEENLSEDSEMEAESSSFSEMSSYGADDYECPIPLSPEEERRLLQLTKINQSRRKNLVPLESLAFREAAKHLDFIYDSNPDMINNLSNGTKTLILNFYCSMHNPEARKSTYFPQTIKRKLPLRVVQALISGSLKQFDFAVCELDASKSQSEQEILSVWKCLAANAGNLKEVSDLKNKGLSVAGIRMYLKDCEHVEFLKLKFYGAVDVDLWMLANKLHRIEELCLSFGMVSIHGLVALKKLGNLQKLQFDVTAAARLPIDEYAYCIFTMMPNLRQIKIKPHHGRSYQLDYCPKLYGLTQTFSLEHIGLNCDEKYYPTIPTILPNIRHLSIVKTENCMLKPSILQQLGNLHSLDITLCNSEVAPDLLLPALELVGTRITDLSIQSSRIDRINLDISRILQLCPNVESLKLVSLKCREPQVFCPLKLKLRKVDVSTQYDPHSLLVSMQLLTAPFLEEARIVDFSFNEAAFRFLDMALDTGLVLENLFLLTFSCECSAFDVTRWFKNLLAKIIAASPKLNITMCEVIPYVSGNPNGGYDDFDEDEMDETRQEFDEEMGRFYKAVSE